MKDNERQEIEKFGQLQENGIFTMTIIGEIEGHQLSAQNAKTTKYEHLLPLLTQVQDNQEIDGLFLLINTVGGDCSCGLAAAEMIASIKKPTVSLVIGDSHSIGVPLSVAAGRKFIAPTATMILHPVRLNGTIIGAPQTFEYFRLIQDRIVTFVEAHTGGFYDEVRGGPAGLLHNSLKTSTSLKYAMLTGIQRVAKENVFSDLNNLDVYTVIDNDYSEYFGFSIE